MSGHNFFASSIVSDEVSYTWPKQIWSNINGKVYKILSNSEKEDLLDEITALLRQENLKIEVEPKESYSKLLYETQGIIYEYGAKLSVGEIIGQKLRLQNSKYTDKDIKEIYVDLELVDANKVYVYLIDEMAKIRSKISISSRLTNAASVVSLYKENGGDYKEYQASVTTDNITDFFVGNAFYPLVNEETAEMAKSFKWTNCVDNIYNNELNNYELDNYVNNLFRNPSYKRRNVLPDGNITFSDNLNISVIYKKTGTLEFEKTLINNTEKLTKIERLNKVNHFIKESGAIPDQLKKGLYLEKIVLNEETDEYSYQFGYRYENGEVVFLSDTIKEGLEINAFLELIIKNSEITKGKWMMVVPEEIKQSQKIKTSALEALERIYEHSNIAPEESVFELDDLECAYVFDNINGVGKFDWIGIYLEQLITATKEDNVE